MSRSSVGLVLLWLGVCLGWGCSRDNPDFETVPDGGGVLGDGAPEPEVGVADGAVDGLEPFDLGEGDEGVEPRPDWAGAEDVGVDAGVDVGVDVGVDGGVDAGVDAGWVDGDGDGVPAGEDCDDGDGEVFPGAEERCDGRDEDCDDGVDEGVMGCCAEGEVRACGAGAGACVPGEQVCDAMGRFGPCVGGVGPGDEVCDGVDDDCDGRVDEGLGLGEACAVALGVCRGEGVRVCDGEGGVECDAVVGAPGVEVCDGVDDDCDGSVDEGLSGQACTVGVGACERSGGEVCGDGVLRCDAVAGDPRVEVCNGVDDDCDGPVDEAVGGGMGCEVGEGACRAAGLMVCDAEGVVRCDAVAGSPGVERCDAVDGDCDGVNDEDWPELGEGCVVGAGDCRAEGVWICTEDGGGVRCAAPPAVGVDEVCDGDDDDCDGAVDEGFGVGEACEAGVGACVRAGVRVCVEGGAGCDAVAGEPGVEVCGGADEDCDGVVDEGLGVGEGCVVGVGACAADGVTVCGPDGVVCEGAPGEGGAEVCDGVDDDCDGRVDEGVGNACGGCGALPVEGCNGVDDDCDGQVDEGLAEVCVVFVGTVEAPPGAVNFGSVVTAAGDLDRDGVADAMVGAPDGDVGRASLVSGTGALGWSFEGPQSLGTAIEVADLDNSGTASVLVGLPGVDNGYVIEVNPAGEEVRRFAGSDDFRAGRQVIAPDGGRWFAMSDPDALATFFGPSGAVRVLTVGPQGAAEATAAGEAGQAVGERLFLAPSGDGVFVTVRPGADRALSPVVVPSGDALGVPIVPPGLTASSFGEGFASGRLLAGEAPVWAIGAPLVNQQTGAVWVYAGGLPVSGALANGGRNARQGHRLAVLPRPAADRDALVVAGWRMTEARIWTFVRAVDGRPVIATSTVVRVAGAQTGFGRALAVSEPGVDGTRRLFVGEPVGGGGRVHVFRVR